MDRENEMIEQMGTWLSLICMGVLEGKTDEFDANERKLNNLYNFVQEEKQKYHQDIKTTQSIMEEAKGKRKHVFEACQQVPFSQLLLLAVAKGKKTSRDPRMKQYLQVGYCIIGVWLDTVLQEHYRMNVEQRKQIFADMNNWIDSVQKGYLTMDMIYGQFIEDMNYDLKRGCRVS